MFKPNCHICEDSGIVSMKLEGNITAYGNFACICDLGRAETSLLRKGKFGQFHTAQWNGQQTQIHKNQEWVFAFPDKLKPITYERKEIPKIAIRNAK
jgi:hypothetical protein